MQVRGRAGKHFLQRFLAHGRARLVDIGIGMVHGVDHLQVGARILGHLREIAGNARLGQAILDKAARAAAQNAAGHAVRAQGLEHLGHVDALAARIQPHGLHAVDLIHGKAGQGDGLVQRRG